MEHIKIVFDFSVMEHRLDLSITFTFGAFGLFDLHAGED